MGDDRVGAGSVALALRHRAAATVADELRRLEGRLPTADEVVRREAAQTLGRVVDALLRAPLARLEQVARAPDQRPALLVMQALLDIAPARQGDTASVGEPGHE